MVPKSGGFLERHIEKIVLAVVGVLCLWLMFARVVVSPNRVSFGDGQFGPEEIDTYLYQQAQDLKARLVQPPKPAEPYDPKVTVFLAMLDSTVDIQTGVDIPKPPHSSWVVPDERKYRVPSVGEVVDVAVEHIRAAAYVPTVPVGEQTSYSQDRSELEDIDLVTVGAKLDVSQLYRNFRDSFEGQYIPEEWRDPCLAQPVFGAVQLQRQQLLEDGSWGEWQSVPRTEVEPRRRMFEIVEDADNLPPGGMQVRLLQFGGRDVLMELLQPEAYKIASADEEWFPPSIHKEYVEFQRKLELEEKREAKEAEQEQREGGRYPMGRGRSLGGRAYMDDEGGFGGGRFGRQRGSVSGGRFDRTRRPGRRSPAEGTMDEDDVGRVSSSAPASTQDFYNKLRESLITRETDLAKIRDSLLFWAHDDTVEPGRTYRYRVRLGVLNPIVQTDWFNEQDKAFTNKAILWSKFSSVTDPVKIPQRMYFFPLKAMEPTKTVNVEVAKYLLGYWYRKAFVVRQGESIGRVVENQTELSSTRKTTTAAEEQEEVTLPDRIDYTTGAVVVDLMRVSDWLGGDGKNLRPRHYFDMLYTYDGSDMAHIAVEPVNWSQDLKAMNAHIRRVVGKAHKPLRGWQDKLMRRLPRAGGAGEEYEDEDAEELEQYYRMTGQGPRY